MRKALFFLVFIGQLLVLPSLLSAEADEGFPGRTKYPDVSFYEKEQLLADFDKVVIVDARSSYEFSTIRIVGAVNIPVASKQFEALLAELRATTIKPIVFYCNGRSCLKSYHAVNKARNAKIENTYAYDAGIFEWAKAYPDHAVLLGKSPVDPNDIIPKAAFQSRCLDPEAFTDLLYNMDAKSLVVDVRDKYQRGHSIGYYPGKERWASLDNQEKLIKYINKAKQEKRTLFIYDEVGKQIRWIQYALEKADLKDYYFMQKGARNYHKVMIER